MEGAGESKEEAKFGCGPRWRQASAELQHNFSPTLKPGADLLSPCISRLQAASRDMMCNLRLSQGQSSGEGKRQQAISSPQSQQLAAGYTCR